MFSDTAAFLQLAHFFVLWLICVCLLWGRDPGKKISPTMDFLGINDARICCLENSGDGKHYEVHVVCTVCASVFAASCCEPVRSVVC